jgi:hypothetical protein
VLGKSQGSHHISPLFSFHIQQHVATLKDEWAMQKSDPQSVIRSRPVSTKGEHTQLAKPLIDGRSGSKWRLDPTVRIPHGLDGLPFTTKCFLQTTGSILRTIIRPSLVNVLTSSRMNLTNLPSKNSMLGSVTSSNSMSSIQCFPFIFFIERQRGGGDGCG